MTIRETLKTVDYQALLKIGPSPIHRNSITILNLKFTDIQNMKSVKYLYNKFIFFYFFFLLLFQLKQDNYFLTFYMNSFK